MHQLTIQYQPIGNFLLHLHIYYTCYYKKHIIDNMFTGYSTYCKHDSEYDRKMNLTKELQHKLWGVSMSYPVLRPVNEQVRVELVWSTLYKLHHTHRCKCIGIGSMCQYIYQLSSPGTGVWYPGLARISNAHSVIITAYASLQIICHKLIDEIWLW